LWITCSSWQNVSEQKSTKLKCCNFPESKKIAKLKCSENKMFSGIIVYTSAGYTREKTTVLQNEIKTAANN